MVKVFVADPGILVITCPIFTNLARIMHMDLVVNLKDLDAEYWP